MVYLQSALGAEQAFYSWRNDASIAGFGALGDLGVHMIDAARFITGLPIERAWWSGANAIPQKKDAMGNWHAVTTDTNSSFLCQFAGGALGTFETTQIAPGYGNYFRGKKSGAVGTAAVLSVAAPGDLEARRTCSSYGTWAPNPLAPITVPTDLSGPSSGTPGSL